MTDELPHTGHTYVAVMLDDANARRYNGTGPDLAAASAPHCIASI